MDREVATRVLGRTCEVFESLDIRYWLDSGTLLGFYRDNDINVYDHDIDIRTVNEGWTVDRIGDLIKELWKMGYSIIKDTGTAREQILAYHMDEVLLDFKFCHIDSRDVWYYCFTDKPNEPPIIHLYPRAFMDNLGVIEFQGREYPCPNPIDEYILLHYGPDWRKFKVRAEDADKTDLTWDYKKDPPIAMTIDEFRERKGVDAPIALQERK